MKPPKNQQGSLLILTLWILAILSFLALSLGYRVTLQIKSAESAVGRFSASYAARAAVAQAITVIKKDLNLRTDSLDELWAEDPADFENISVGEGSFSVSYMLGEKEIFGLQDEESKINLNTATLEVLQNLFDMLEIEEDLASNLMDWIDDDDDDRNHGRGAEKDYYENLSVPLIPKNGPLENLSELHLIKGFTPEVIDKLAPHVTVHGSGKINLNTAAQTTLEAIGFGESFFSKVRQYRLGKDKLPGTEDDGVAVNHAEFMRELEELEKLGGDEKILLNKFKNYFTFTSTAFLLRGKAFSNRGFQKNFSAVLSIKKGKDVEVVAWHEN